MPLLESLARALSLLQQLWGWGAARPLPLPVADATSTCTPCVVSSARCGEVAVVPDVVGSWEHFHVPRHRAHRLERTLAAEGQRYQKGFGCGDRGVR